MSEQVVEELWLPVIGRALAYLCMQNAEMGSATIVRKAQFLRGLGLDVGDVAQMLGTTPASIYELMRRAKNSRKKGAKQNASTKRKKRQA